MGTQVAIQQGCMQPLALIRMVYNAVFWIFLLPFLTSVNYGTGFIVFSIIIWVRLAANLYTNNIGKLTPEQYENFPFRI